MGFLSDLHELTAPVLTDLMLVRDLSDVSDPDKKMLLATLSNLVLGQMVFDVTAYGAVADGTTNTATAIQAAITAAVAAGGGTVWIPRTAAKYKMTGALTLASNIWLMSDGAILDTDGNSNDPVIKALSASNVRVSGLHIEGDGNVTILSMDGCSNVYIDSNDIDQTPVANNVNVAAIRIRSDAAATARYDQIWVVNNRIKPTYLGILAQSRQTGNPEMHGLFIMGNHVDYVNCSAATQGTSYGGAIKVDVNIVDCVVVDNICDGRSICRDGINVQEDITGVVVSGNTVRNFTRMGIVLGAGQGVLAVQDAIVSNNVISNMIISVAANPSAELPAAISINAATATGWKNISIANNIIRDSAGYGIYEDSGDPRIVNLRIDGNTIDGCANTGIYVRSHRVGIRNNIISGTPTYAIHLVGSAAYCVVTGNRWPVASPIFDQGVTTIIQGNVIGDVWENGVLTAAIRRKWAVGDWYIVEAVVTGLTLPVTVTTTIDLGIDVAQFGTDARGAYLIEGSIVSGDGSSNVQRATFVGSMRMTAVNAVSSQSGAFLNTSNALFSAVTLDTDFTNLLLKITNSSGSIALDNMMISYTIMKTDDL